MCRVETKDTVTECFGKKVCEKAYRDGEMICVHWKSVSRQDESNPYTNNEEPHRFTKHQLVIRADQMPIKGVAQGNKEAWGMYCL